MGLWPKEGWMGVSCQSRPARFVSRGRDQAFSPLRVSFMPPVQNLPISRLRLRFIAPDHPVEIVLVMEHFTHWPNVLFSPRTCNENRLVCFYSKSKYCWQVGLMAFALKRFVYQFYSHIWQTVVIEAPLFFPFFSLYGKIFFITFETTAS